jgi:hypothetical protein
VPNDTTLAPETAVQIITGPNMSGKSTFLRQTALITLLAQIGSFVPADRARIGVVDRIFTRLGASDEIHRGQSTFMVEMVETANILNHATSRSLLLLDEIGRGTSTYDGLAIAWAVIEYIHNHPKLRAKTLFATHYHELTDLAERLPSVVNYNVAVDDSGRPRGCDLSASHHPWQGRPLLRRARGAHGRAAGAGRHARRGDLAGPGAQRRGRPASPGRSGDGADSARLPCRSRSLRMYIRSSRRCASWM